jgi:microcystin-dependent protein
MYEPFLGMIVQFPYNFPPQNWTFCHGQIMDIQHNTALFSLIGTTYGGDGIHNFKLPDLRPRNEHGDLLNIQIGDIYQGKPYIEYSICLNGIFPSRN